MVSLKLQVLFLVAVVVVAVSCNPAEREPQSKPSNRPQVEDTSGGRTPARQPNPPPQNKRQRRESPLPPPGQPQTRPRPGPIGGLQRPMNLKADGPHTLPPIRA